MEKFVSGRWELGSILSVQHGSHIGESRINQARRERLRSGRRPIVVLDPVLKTHGGSAVAILQAASFIRPAGMILHARCLVYHSDIR